MEKINILVIDDQISVLEGISGGGNFSALGIENVFLADSAGKARDILSQQEIAIMLCDIEMPGEDGLSLNRWVKEHYPNVIRILLTSHAEFPYAQESIHLGCFDYILQPAPFDEIENALRRAIAKIRQDEQNCQLEQKGRLYEYYQPDMMERYIRNLYSPNAENVETSISALQAAGYHISVEETIFLVIIDVYTYVERSNPAYNDTIIRKAIRDALSAVDPVLAGAGLISENPHHLYVLVLPGVAGRLSGHYRETFQEIYQEMSDRLGIGFGFYVGNHGQLWQVRSIIGEIHLMINNNVTRNPGTAFQEDMSTGNADTLNLEENMSRWKRMLESQEFGPLQDGIFSYIGIMASMKRLTFNDLCDLHQKLTQLFFSFAYARSINIIGLFGEQYSYNNYMDAFSDVDALKKGIGYMLQALARATVEDSDLGDVERAKQYILDNVSHNIMVRDVAEYVYRSPEYFTKVFKDAEGVSIKTYITQVKINVAKDMLATPNIPVSLVATETGYDNFSHFTQVFKKYENITPTDYRKKILEEKKNPE